MIFRLPRALFIDLDGTLADSLPAMRAVYDAFLAEHGREGDDAEFQLLNGPSLPEIVATLKARHGLSPTTDCLESRYRSLIAARYASEARPAPGARELLARAAGRKIAAWIVTSAEQALAERFLSAHGLTPLISGVVSAEGLARGKPHPDVYLRAIARADVDPADAWAIEDSPNGARAALDAGLRTFAFADVVSAERIASLDDVTRLLDDVTIDLIDAPLRIMATRDLPAVTPALLARIDAMWQRERAARPELFDGTLLTLSSRDGETFRGRFVPYRYYLAQRRDENVARALRLVPLAVCGVLCCGGAVAVARRSDRLTQYPGFLELVPSGGISAEKQLPSDAVDYEAQLLTELFEETGIDSTHVSSIRPLAVVRDNVDVTVDLAVLIEVDAPARTLAEQCAAANSEYRALAWIERRELAAFVETHRQELVPVSRALCDAIIARAVEG